MKRAKKQKKMTHEEFVKKIKKWGWICKYIPHQYILIENEVVSGWAICLRCGNMTATDGINEIK